MPNKYLDSVQLARLVTKIKDHVSTSISTAISGSITTLIDQAKAEAILAAHPVGSYYWSDDSTSPATLFGGTWQALPAGYTLIAQGSGTDSFGNFTYTAGQTYGERMHTLTVGEMARHSHGITLPTNQSYSEVTVVKNNYLVWGTGVGWTGTEINGHTASFSTGAAGSNAAHNNIQPSKAAYCWRRTA